MVQRTRRRRITFRILDVLVRKSLCAVTPLGAPSVLSVDTVPDVYLTPARLRGAGSTLGDTGSPYCRSRVRTALQHSALLTAGQRPTPTIGASSTSACGWRAI
jgi:hypothetical protein